MFDKLLLLYFGPVTQPNRNIAQNQSSNHSQTELICRSSRSLEMIRMVRNLQGVGATPVYKLYRDVRPQKVWFFSRYGHREAGRTPPPTFSGSYPLPGSVSEGFRLKTLSWRSKIANTVRRCRSRHEREFEAILVSKFLH